MKISITIVISVLLILAANVPLSAARKIDISWTPGDVLVWKKIPADLVKVLEKARSIAFYYYIDNWSTEGKRSALTPSYFKEYVQQFSHVYKVIEINDRPGLVKKLAFSQSGLVKNPLKLGRMVNADIMVFLSVKEPTYTWVTHK